LFSDGLGITLDPEGTLLPGIDEALYGTTGRGGAFPGGGTVFRMLQMTN
jgi:hypothetical protein